MDERNVSGSQASLTHEFHWSPVRRSVDRAFTCTSRFVMRRWRSARKLSTHGSPCSHPLWTWDERSGGRIGRRL